MGGKITRLKVQTHNKDRVNVYLDGEFAFGLARITASWLEVGQELSDEKIAELRAADSHEAAYQKALRFLSYRPRSEAEIRRNLKGKHLPEEVIESVMARLQRAGLADDHAFARFWVENRETFRPRSRWAMATELRQKGVAHEVIESALADVDEEQAAYRAAISRMRRLQGLPWQDFRNKLGGHLARRGFSYDTISPIVERVWQEMDSEKLAEKLADDVVEDESED